MVTHVGLEHQLVILHHGITRPIIPIRLYEIQLSGSQLAEAHHPNRSTTFSATAWNITQSSLLPTMINVPTTNPSFLISPTIQDTTHTINLNARKHKWCSNCHSILTGVSGTDSSLTSLLKVSHYVTLYHYLFRYSKKCPTTY